MIANETNDLVERAVAAVIEVEAGDAGNTQYEHALLLLDNAWNSLGRAEVWELGLLRLRQMQVEARRVAALRGPMVALLNEVRQVRLQNDLIRACEVAGVDAYWGAVWYGEREDPVARVEAKIAAQDAILVQVDPALAVDEPEPEALAPDIDPAVVDTLNARVAELQDALDTKIETLQNDVERSLSAAAAAADSERLDVLDENRHLERRLNTDIAATLVADSDKLRAEVTKPDLKASVLVAAAVGAVVAGGGALGTANLPVAAVGTGVGAVAAAVASVVMLLVAMRPGVSTDPDALVTSQIRDAGGQVDYATQRVQDSSLEALGVERETLQRLALRKFRLVRWAIDGALGAIGLAVVTGIIVAVSALVGGA